MQNNLRTLGAGEAISRVRGAASAVPRPYTVTLALPPTTAGNPPKTRLILSHKTTGSEQVGQKQGTRHPHPHTLN